MYKHLKYLLPFIFLSSIQSQNLSNILKNIESRLDSKSTSGSTKSLQDSLSAPSIVQSFTHQDLEKYENLSDFLSYEASVHTVEKNNGNYILETRNLASDTHNNKAMIIVNGHKFVSNHLGPEFFLDVIPYESIKRLEVIKGTGSVLYGSNAFSVLINIITFDGGGYDNSRYKLSLSPNNIQKAQINLFDQHSDISSLFLSLKLQSDSSGRNVSHLSQKTGYIDDFKSKYGAKNLFGVYKYKNITLNFGHKRSHNNSSYNDLSGYTDVQPRGGVVGQLLLQAPFSNMLAAGTPRTTVVETATNVANQLLTTGPAQRESYRKNKHSFMGLYNKRKLSDKTDYNFSISWNVTRSSIWLQEVFPGLLDHSSSYDTELQVNHKFNDKMSSTFGYNRESIKASEYVPGFTHFGLGPKSPVNIAKDYRFIINGLYIQNQLSLSKKLNLLFANRFNKSKAFGQAHSPKIALSYSIEENEIVKLIYGKNFRWPSIFEKLFQTTTLIPNANIRPEMVIATELQWIKKNYKNNYSITLYKTKLKDSLSLEHFIGVNGNRLAWYSNSDPANHTGIEFSHKHQFNKKTNYFSSIGYHNVEQINRVATSLLVPTENLQQIQIGFTHLVNERWRLNTYSSFFGGRTGTKYNAQKLDYEPTKLSSYVVHNLTLQYKINQNKNFKVAVTNLLNKKFIINSGALLSSRHNAFPRGRQIVLSYSAEF